MGTATRLSKFILGGSDKIAEQQAKKIKATIKHPEPTVEKNLYTILGFKNREDFESKRNRLVNKEIWQLFVNVFEKEIGYTANKEVVKNIICNIAKSHSGNAFIKTEHIILNGKQGSKERKKAIEKAIGILRKMSQDKALGELSIMKVQAKDFLQSDFYQVQSKQLEGFAPSGAQLFAETLKYIESLEKLSQVKKDELVKDFLENHVKSLNKKYPKLQSRRKDAIAILSSDELRKIYNDGVRNGILQPMATHKEFKDLTNRLDNARNKLQEIIERKELEKDLETIDTSIVNAVNEIKKHREAIHNCKNFQNPYIKEKEEHPLRGNACQKMIDIYQERIVEHQKKIYQSLIPISELFKNMPQTIKDLPNVKEFQEIMDDVQKESNIQQADGKIGQALICLLNARNRLAVQLEQVKDPSTEFSLLRINTETKITRL